MNENILAIVLLLYFTIGNIVWIISDFDNYNFINSTHRWLFYVLLWPYFIKEK